MKGKTVGILIVVLALMMSLPAANAIKPPIDELNYYVEYLGQVTKDVVVPVLVLYDPSGDGSSTSYEKQQSVGLGYSFDLISGPGLVAIDSHATVTTTVSRGMATSENLQKDHQVYCEIFRQKWKAYYYITPSRSYYKLILSESNPTGGWGCYRFNELPGDVFVQDKSGTVGPYHAPRNVPYASHQSETIEYYTDFYIGIGAGIKVTIGGLGFELIVKMVITTGEHWKVTYNYYDSDQNMAFDINCNSAIGGSIIPDMVCWFNPDSF